MDNNETLADILAEMREGCVFAWEGCKFEGLADRIDAAAQREKVEAVTIAATKAVNLTDEKWRRDTGNADAALIVEAVNERDRLRDLVKRIEEEVDRCHKRDGQISQELIDAVYEARAIGEAEP